MFNGCGVYQFTEPKGKGIFFQEITSSFELKRKMQNDWLFRQNYITFATNQSSRWYAEYYTVNSMWHRGISRWDFYWNRNEIWWNWGFNSNNWWGYEWYKPSYYRYNWGQSQDIAYINSRRYSNAVTIRIRKNKIDDIYNNINKSRNKNEVRNYKIPNPTVNSRPIRDYGNPNSSGNSYSPPPTDVGKTIGRTGGRPVVGRVK